MLYSNTHSAPTAETFLSFFWRAPFRPVLMPAGPQGFNPDAAGRKDFNPDAAGRHGFNPDAEGHQEIPHAVAGFDNSEVYTKLLDCIKIRKPLTTLDKIPWKAWC